jgi:hypothetical protein
VGILDAVIRALLYLCCIALAFFLILWVLSALGIALPPMVIVILRIMFVLIAILVLMRLFWPVFSGYQWFPNRRNPP